MSDVLRTRLASFLSSAACAEVVLCVCDMLAGVLRTSGVVRVSAHVGFMYCCTCHLSSLELLLSVGGDTLKYSVTCLSLPLLVEAECCVTTARAQFGPPGPGVHSYNAAAWWVEGRT